MSSPFSSSLDLRCWGLLALGLCLLASCAPCGLDDLALIPAARPLPPHPLLLDSPQPALLEPPLPPSFRIQHPPTA